MIEQTFGVKLGYHQGNVALYLAQKYGTLEQVILELVQNLLDKKAQTALIRLNLKRRRLQSWDDGLGASLEEITRRINCVGQRQKGDDDIGEKGIGNLAPLAVGAKYRIITRDATVHNPPPFFEIILDREAVAGQRDVEFAGKHLPVSWGFKDRYAGMSSYIDVQDIDGAHIRRLAKIPNLLDEIVDTIAQTFPGRIRDSGIKIRIEVVDEKGVPVEKIVHPIEFPGRREEFLIETPRGTVSFEVYLTVTQVKNPRVLVDHQGKYSFPLSNLRDVWPAVSHFFGCGYVQGRIRVDFCTIDPDRTNFEVNEGLEAFQDAVLQFVVDYGEPWLERLKEQREEDRLMEVAERVIRNLESDIFQDPELVPEFFKKPDRTPEPPPTQTRKKVRKKAEVPSIRRAEPKARKPRAYKVQSSQLRIVFKEGDETHGNLWRARLGSGGDEARAIVINLTHRDMIDAEQHGNVALQQYIGFLVATRLAGLMAPNQAQVPGFIDVAESWMLPYVDAMRFQPGK